MVKRLTKKGDLEQGYLCVRPSDLSVTSKSPSNKPHVHPLREYNGYLTNSEQKKIQK
jgi:hypothetical protein